MRRVRVLPGRPPCVTAAEHPVCTAGGAHGQRSVLQQHVCGIAFRQRRRCAACTASSDKGEIKTFLKVVPSELLGPDYRGPCDLEELIRLELRHVGEPGQGCPAHAHLDDVQRAAAGVCQGIRVYTGNRWERSPPVLFVIVQRVIGEWYDRRPVRFPQILRPVDSECEYDFSGVVVHQGESATSGHYYAYASVGVNEYAKFDDSTVHLQTWAQIARNHQVHMGAYVFAYVRRAGPRGGGGGRAAAGSAGGAGGSAGAGPSGAPPAPPTAPLGHAGGRAAGSAGSGDGGGGAASSAPAAPSAPPSAPAGQQASGGEPPGKRRRAGGGDPGAGDGDPGASGQPQQPLRRGKKRGLSPPALGSTGDEDDDAGRAAGVPSADPAPAGVQPGAGASLAGDEWRRFTPENIDTAKCMARTWADGAGGQCRSAPKQGCGDLCGQHFKQQHKDGWHGRVDGPILEGKLKVFKEKNAGKAPRAAPAAEAGATGEGAGRAAVVTRAGAGSASGSGRGGAARAEAAPG
jgi:hypothetical protein